MIDNKMNDGVTLKPCEKFRFIWKQEYVPIFCNAKNLNLHRKKYPLPNPQPPSPNNLSLIERQLRPKTIETILKHVSSVKSQSKSKPNFPEKLLLLKYSDLQEVEADFRADVSQLHQEVDEAIANSCIGVIKEELISSDYSHMYFTYYPNPPQYVYDFKGINSNPYSYISCTMLQNKRITPDETQTFIINRNNIEDDGRTTIMVRNIPNGYTQDMLMRFFSTNHQKKIDFFYLPIDKYNDCNVGYAFLNFIHAKFMLNFYDEFHGQRWAHFNSEKICIVCYAKFQGTAQLQNHFKDSRVLNQRDRKFRPLIGINQLVRRQQEQSSNFLPVSRFNQHQSKLIKDSGEFREVQEPHFATTREKN